MNTVYVVNYSGHNISLANKFGELKILTEGKVDIFKTDRWLYEFTQAMLDFDDKDYLLLSGSPVLNCMAKDVASEMSDIVRVLIYNAKNICYEVRTFSGENLKGIIEGIRNGGFTNTKADVHSNG